MGGSKGWEQHYLAWSTSSNTPCRGVLDQLGRTAREGTQSVVPYGSESGFLSSNYLSLGNDSPLSQPTCRMHLTRRRKRKPPAMMRSSIGSINSVVVWASSIRLMLCRSSVHASAPTQSHHASNYSMCRSNSAATLQHRQLY